MKENTNDQQHIIDALATSDYTYVWEQIKYVGFRKVGDINLRYSIFCDVVSDFDYTKNNNFIQYFISRLTYYTASKNDTFFVSSNRTIIHTLRNENISPTDCKKSKLAYYLKDWNN